MCTIFIAKILDATLLLNFINFTICYIEDLPYDCKFCVGESFAQTASSLV